LTYRIKIDGTEETKAVRPTYTLEVFPAVHSARFLIIDNDGSMAEKYTPEDYMFSEVTIEEPVGTTVWRGRINILKAVPPYVLVGCEGWLAQLRDYTIDYEPRWDLDGSGLREDTPSSVDYANDKIVGTNMNNAALNGYTTNLMLVVTTASNQTRSDTQHAYTSWKYGRYTYTTGDYQNTHSKDGNLHSIVKSYTTGGVVARLYFAVHTDVKQSLVSDIDVKVKSTASADGVTWYVKIYNWNTDSWDTLHTYTTAAGGDETDTAKSKNYVSADGEIWFAFETEATTSAFTINVDFLEVDVNFTGAYQPNRFQVSQIANGNEIYLSDDITNAADIGTSDTFSLTEFTIGHIANASNPAGVIQSNDYMKTLTLDATSNYYGSTEAIARNYENMTPFDILKYYVESLKTPILLYENADATFRIDQYYPHTTTRTIDDTTPCQIETLSDASTLTNKIKIDGATGISETLENKISQETYQGAVKGRYIKDETIGNQPAARAQAQSILARESTIQPRLTVTLHEANTWHPAQYVYVDRTIDVKIKGGYVIVQKTRDYAANTTQLTLNPVGVFTQPYSPSEASQRLTERVQRIEQQL